MKAEDVKEGLYVRWKADRMFKTWDTYGKIVKVEDGQATILTYDTFKETTIGIRGEAMGDEISIVSKEEVEDYVAKRISLIMTTVTEKNIEHKKEIRDLATKKYLLESLVL